MGVTARHGRRQVVRGVRSRRDRRGGFVLRLRVQPGDERLVVVQQHLQRRDDDRLARFENPRGMLAGPPALAEHARSAAAAARGRSAGSPSQLSPSRVIDGGVVAVAVPRGRAAGVWRYGEPPTDTEFVRGDSPAEEESFVSCLARRRSARQRRAVPAGTGAAWRPAARATCPPRADAETNLFAPGSGSPSGRTLFTGTPSAPPQAGLSDRAGRRPAGIVGAGSVTAGGGGVTADDV